MRAHLKSMAGWLFALAFLVLPNCGLPSGEGDPGGGCESEAECGGCDGDGGTDCGGVTTNFKPGDQPWNSAIFCDIEDMNTPRRCALSADLILTNLPRSRAAVDLVSGISDTKTVLDYSDAAAAALGCSPGTPVVITYLSPFPVGQQTCLDCSEGIGGGYSDVNTACIDLCRDMNGDGSDAFCTSDHAKAATNAGDGCFAGACDEGSPVTGWNDPRRTAEPVIWNLPTDGSVSTSGADANTLKRDADTTTPDPAFDAGAYSVQTIEHGDGYVEFVATEDTTARVCGLALGAADSDVSDLDIDFGIRLTAGGHIIISEKGTMVVPPNGDDINYWFADYNPGDTLRVMVTANPDGVSANIEYFLRDTSCTVPGCPMTKLRPSDGDPPITALYPFRVDASLRDKDATLTDVRIVRIKN